MAQLTIPLPDGLSPFLQVLAEPNRLRILALLSGGERCVCDIETALALPQNLVSHHLKVLKRSGLLQDRRSGRWVYYRLAPDAVTEQLRALMALLEPRAAEPPASPCNDDAGL